MPMYEYRCSHCELRFEVLQRIGQGAEGLKCPECGRSEVERQLSTFAGQSSAGQTSAGSGFSAAAACGGGGGGFT